ncbi:uncharacterized protein [Montipora capricornis]|uniref:uncharacterized protein n=1 Tax=Montipora capricornis TaxID=246305 RepID=UPI0035F12D97
MDARTYNILSNSSCSWICEQCGLPNFSTSFVNSSTSFESPNSFSSLSGSSAQLLTSSTSIWSPSPQQNTSKSQRAAFATKKSSSTKNNLQSPRSLNIVIANCNGIGGRKSNPEFQSFINHHSPDIMLGCESKLDGEPTYSVFPSNYTVYRKDRNSAGGGVFIAIKDTFASYPLYDADTNCEIVWASLQLNGCKKLILASYYRPPKSSIDEVEQFCTSVDKVFASHSPNYPQLLIGGDFNLPGINWETTNEFHAPSPSHDHDAIFFELDIRPKLNPKPDHHIYLYKKADMDKLEQEIDNIAHEFCAKHNSSDFSVDENWNHFKLKLQQAIDKHIPQKQVKSNRKLPWITTQLKRMIRKRERLFKKARRSKLASHWQSYKSYRNSVKKQIQQAHESYVNEVIGGSLEEGNAKSFSITSN